MEKLKLADIHNHSLFGVDDGAKAEEDSLQMLRMAAADGICALLLTPHWNKNRQRVDEEECKVRIQRLKEFIKEEGLPLKIAFGAELYYVEELPQMLSEGKARTLNGTKYVLVEFDPNVEYRTLLNGLLRIQAESFLPILAHIERYECFLASPELAEEIKNRNFLIQLNADSVTGAAGRTVKRFCKRMLEKGWADVIATDAHGVHHRKPVLSEAYKVVSKKYGRDYAESLFYNNPLQILRGKSIRYE